MAKPADRAYRNSIIQERFTKHYNVQYFVDMNFFEYSKYCHRIHGSNQRRKQKDVEHLNLFAE